MQARHWRSTAADLTTIMKQQSIYKGRVIELALETIKLPNGSSLQLEVIHHPGGAAVVAQDRHQRVCLLRQYRHAAGGWLWELPAGKIDAGEDPATTARRELAEEAGLETGKLEPLGRTLTTPGFCDEVIHLFRATDLRPCQTGHETHEVIEIHWLPVSQALEQVRDGTIYDAKTMLGLLLAFPDRPDNQRKPM